MNFETLNLRERPEFAETCAAWVYGEWGCQRAESCFQKVLTYLNSAGPDSDLLECRIAVNGAKPLGMACLKRVEHPDRPDLSPWLGSVYVHPLFRGRKISYNLIADIERQAAEVYGYRECHLQTAIPKFYERLGWAVIDRVRDTMGLNADGWFLMKKAL
ncbi:MAG: GNAT family N-acetyltransferase [Alphaproteobacteria bacterium]